jgi:hypothetical protein
MPQAPQRPAGWLQQACSLPQVWLQRLGLQLQQGLGLPMEWLELPGLVRHLRQVLVSAWRPGEWAVDQQFLEAQLMSRQKHVS